MPTPYKSWSDQQIEQLINGIHGGDITRTNLPEDLYLEIKGRLNKAVFEGFGGEYADYTLDTEKGLVMAGFESNIAIFSAAKTFQQVNDMTNLLFDADGNKIPFAEFKGYATEIFDEYNVNWLKTEYNTAVSQAIAGRNWTDIQANGGRQLLIYSTIGDSRVREEHRALDGIKLPANHSFWLTYFPPNNFNCRCEAAEADDEDQEHTKIEDLDLPYLPELFQMNAGVDKVIFDESKHPYFRVEKRFADGLKDNFGLPFTPEVKPAPASKDFVPLKNAKEAKAFLVKTVEENSQMKIGKVEFSSSLSMEQINARTKQVNALFKEYKVTEVFNSPAAGTNIAFKSSKTAYGYIKAALLPSTRSAEVRAMNFGSATDSAFNRIFDPEAMVTRMKSAVDLKNLEIATTTHEFAHVIALSDYLRYSGDENLKNFFKELNIIKTEYNAELGTFYQTNDKAAINEISLGKYASTNLNEFMAEGFTEYKLKAKPSKYASKIGELIDKHFKR